MPETTRPLAIGIDLGGTQIRAALVDPVGIVVARLAVATKATAGVDVVVSQLQDVARDVAAHPHGGTIVGVGVSSPGPLDTDRGVALAIPTLAGFSDIPLRHMLAERLGLPVCLENDGIAAALGEWRFGAGQGHSNLVYVTVSTGIGGGVVADGRLLRGRQGMAGHIGHMTIQRDGVVCACGNRGCWEAYGSGPSFARWAATRAADQSGSALGRFATIEASQVFAAAADGDALARALVAEEADILGVGIVSLLHLYSPEVVVLGGGVASSFAMLEPGIAARIAADAMPAFRDVRVVPAGLGGNSGLVGAAALAFEAWWTSDRQK